MKNIFIIATMLLTSGAVFAQNLMSESFYSEYKSLPDIGQALLDITNTYPTLASTVNLGSTYEGREIIALRLTNSQSSGAKSQFVIDAGYQGRDWASTAVCLYLIKAFVENPALLSQNEIYIIPVVNGDGYEYTQNTDRLALKNRNGQGVDLQRNFNFHWGEVGGSNTPSDNKYYGAVAASEPETKAMQSFFAGLTNFKGYIYLSSIGQYIASPWGWSNNNTPEPDRAENFRVANLMRVAIAGVNNTQYIDGDSYANFMGLNSGNSADYVYGVRKVAYTYCLKLNDYGNGYTLPTNKIVPLGKEIFAGVKAMVTEVCCK